MISLNYKRKREGKFMKEKFILMNAEAMFNDGVPVIRYIGYIKGTDENFMFFIDFDFWNQIFYEYDGDERLADDACIKYAMNKREHYNIDIERSEFYE